MHTLKVGQPVSVTWRGHTDSWLGKVAELRPGFVYPIQVELADGRLIPCIECEVVATLQVEEIPDEHQGC